MNGRDLIEIGYHPDNTLGQALNDLLNEVIDGKLPNSREELLKEAEGLLHLINCTEKENADEEERNID